MTKITNCIRIAKFRPRKKPIFDFWASKLKKIKSELFFDVFFNIFAPKYFIHTE